MKIDCNITKNFVSEHHRMCKVYYEGYCNKTHKDGTIEWCPFREKNRSGHIHGRYCNYIGTLTQDDIDIVQKWSDEHPQETMAEHFFKLFPDAMRLNDADVPRLCPHYIGWGEDVKCPKPNGKYATCEECWNRPYVEGGADNGN